MNPLTDKRGILIAALVVPALIATGCSQKTRGTNEQNFAQAEDFVNESLYAAGYAAGLVLKQNGGTKAGYITGPELDFSKAAAKAYEVGIRSIVPNAQVVTTYTGDFDDSAKAKEAA